MIPTNNEQTDWLKTIQIMGKIVSFGVGLVTGMTVGFLMLSFL